MYKFSSDQFTTLPSYTALPAGVYSVRISDASFGALNSGNGYGVKLKFEVLEGAHMGRKIWAILNVIHSNPEAQRIAQSDLRKLCDACGGVVITDTSTHLLVGKTLRVRLRIRIDAVYGDRNEVIGYEPAIGLPTTASFIATSAAAMQQPAPTNWHKP